MSVYWIGCLTLQGKLNDSGVAHDAFRKRMRALLEEVKARGEPKADDQSIAGLLLKLKDPKTGMLSASLQPRKSYICVAPSQCCQTSSCHCCGEGAWVRADSAQQSKGMKLP